MRKAAGQNPAASGPYRLGIKLAPPGNLLKSEKAAALKLNLRFRAKEQTDCGKTASSERGGDSGPRAASCRPTCAIRPIGKVGCSMARASGALRERQFPRKSLSRAN